MFIDGDIVKVKPEWLEPEDDPDQTYIVLEYFRAGAVKLLLPDDQAAFGGYQYVWPDSAVYKVGHMDLTKKIFKKLV